MPTIRIGPVTMSFPEKVTYYEPLPNVKRVEDVFALEGDELVLHRSVLLNTPLNYIRLTLGNLDEPTAQAIEEGIREFAEQRLHDLQLSDEGVPPVQEQGGCCEDKSCSGKRDR